MGATSRAFRDSFTAGIRRRGALRLARASAVTRSRPAAFVLADAAQRPDGAAAVDGGSWLVKFLSSVAPRETAAGAELVLAAAQLSQNRQ